ncbi:MAG TPA: AAA family ATPase [Actinocrinis sp.]|uniref:AAA family ATPase n=1 Tax=Actinocrinis sp. TaxID=1920516 RepID=UPI002DDCE0DA|nr:AAA family ATPase [Actinocrinis sp.]HEV3168720.1 AAA family ATPase [Actinocrinis sp.]
MLAIRLIGGLEIGRDGTRIAPPAGRRARALLAWLALRPGRHPRSRLAAQFWPDVLDASARASLRSAVWALRASLGPDGGAYLSADRETVALDGEGLTVDVREFDRLAAAGHFGEAVALCRGELLDGFDDEWAGVARESHLARLANVLGALAREAEADGRGAEALNAAQWLLQLRPLDESVCRDAMRLLAAAGDVAAALELYERTCSRIRAELGCAPSPATTALALQLRGGPEPVRAAARINAADAPLNRPIDSQPLVGRGVELGVLTLLWQRTHYESGGVVVVAGEGGIGKTRLCEALRAEAGRFPGAMTATGTAGGGAGAPTPLAVWSEALGDLITQLDRSAIDPAAAPYLARLVPAAAADLPAAAPNPASPDTPVLVGHAAAEPQLERVRVFEAVAGLVIRAAREGPVLLVLEDMHAADPSSLELAVYVGRRITRLPVLLLLTRRRLPPRPDLEAALAALRARGALRRSLDLTPLPTATVRQLIHSVVDLPGSTVEQIAAASGGSPLLAVEAALACSHGGEPVLGLAEATRAAVYRLSPAARRLVELLAVAGRDVEHADLLTLPLPDPERAETEALGADLLRARSGMIGFRHALLAEAVYRDLPDPERARLHDSFAELLRRRAGGPAGGRRAAEIARHLRLAGRDTLAVGQLARAAADARAVGALPEAAGFLHEAVAIDPHDADLYVELAEVEAWRGLQEESDAAFGRALELIAPDDDGSLISAWLRRGRWLRGGLCYPRESRRAYRSALDVLDRDPSADPYARAEALAGLAWAEAVAGDPAQCGWLLRDVDLALGRREAPSDLLTHDIGFARAHALIRSARFAESYAPLVAASAAAGRAGRPDMAYSCLINAASAAACTGDFERALDFADRCLPLVEPNGLLRPCVYAHSARATLLRRLGRLDEARVACRAEAEFAERVGRAELEGLADHDRGLLALACGDTADAVRLLTRSLELGAPVSRPLARLWLAEALVRAGQYDAADRQLRETALEPVAPGDFPDTLVARMNRVQGLAAAARGDRERARARLTEASEGWRRRLGNAATGDSYVAALIDLGRPPLSSLTEPEWELAAIETELAALDT